MLDVMLYATPCTRMYDEKSVGCYYVFTSCIATMHCVGADWVVVLYFQNLLYIFSEVVLWLHTQSGCVMGVKSGMSHQHAPRPPSSTAQ